MKQLVKAYAKGGGEPPSATTAPAPAAGEEPAAAEEPAEDAPAEG